MTDIVFLNEHLLIGNLGHISIVIAFITAILASVSFFYSNAQPLDKSWIGIAKTALHIHSISVITIVATLFTIIYNHYFEYHYAWQHSSRDLPVHFMISCFWEGQEGSFLLWIFWQMIIAQFINKINDNYSKPVLGIIMLSQIALTSMLLGVKIIGYKLGSSPFELLRNVMQNAPIFKQPDYLSKVKDGNGLNPLLQNYWMVIHPPTLFLGFASTIVPFAYVIAALINKSYQDWIQPGIKWSLFTAMILGTGIIMGGFWAYESLSFGGYWAWDPVENASLVPWLILIAGVHVLLVYKSTGNSFIPAIILIISSFLLVLYATFLTRSGILGNSSVHSFTDLGMSGQLLVYFILFILVALVLLVLRWKELPSSEKDEQIYTREFWMFIGSMILVISSFQIILTTSIPVFNKIFSLKLAPPADVIQHYNKWQMPLAILIAIFTAVAQSLKYKTNKTPFNKLIFIQLLGSVILAILFFFLFDLNAISHGVLLFAAIFSVVVNGKLIFPYLIGRFKLAGASIAHIGFGILLIGVLVSSAKKQVISINQSGQALNPEFNEKENTENIYLERNKPGKMGDYIITYKKDSQNWVNTYYQVNYQKLKSDGSVDYTFDLYPNGQINPKFGLVANPDTKHYLSHDVFTYVSSVPTQKSAATFVNPHMHEVKTGDTIYLNQARVVLVGISSNTDAKDLDEKNLKVLLGAELKVIGLDKVYDAMPMYGVQANKAQSFDAVVEEVKLRFSFKGVNPQTGTIQLETAEKDESGDFIIMKAIVFPWINLVWAGTIIMIVGFIISIVNRLNKRNTLNNHF